jgi:HK97 family phage major capsid protein
VSNKPNVNLWRRRLPNKPVGKPGRLYNTAPTPTDVQPETAAQWSDWLHSNMSTPDDAAKAMNDGRFKKAHDHYFNAVLAQKTAEASDLAAQVEASSKAALAQLLKDQPNAGKIAPLNLNHIGSGRSRRNIYDNPKAVGAPINGVFEDMTSFFQAVAGDRTKVLNNSSEALEKLEKIRNYSTTVPSEGGLLVPEEFRSDLMRLAVESAVIRPRARVIPMSNPRLNYPAVDETSRVSNIYGGVVVTRVEEGSDFDESSASFRSVKLDVTKQVAFALAPNELVRDWSAFGGFIDDTFPTAISFAEDVDFISGTGSR